MSYQIHEQNFYYQGHIGGKQNGYLTDDYGEILNFETEVEAQEYLDENYPSDEVFYLSHGEYSRPEYTITEDFSYPEREFDCFHADGDETGLEPINKETIPEEVLEKLLEGGCELESCRDGYDVYTYAVDDDDAIYQIIYLPTSEALQRAGNDLSSLNWDNYAFGVEYL